jgi:hypothetical protein
MSRQSPRSGPRGEGIVHPGARRARGGGSERRPAHSDLGFTVAERFPDRFINAGVADKNMVGLSTGLAEAGFRPYVYSIATVATLRAAGSSEAPGAPAAAGADRQRQRRARVRHERDHPPRALGRRGNAGAAGADSGRAGRTLPGRAGTPHGQRAARSLVRTAQPSSRDRV